MRRRIVLLGLTLAGLALPGGFAVSADPAKPDVKAKGPLAELPSPPGAHLEKIKTLADNTWLELGVPAADPKWGRARGRAWTAKMPLAPELRGAFLFGEGVHGYAKPDGHYMDDLWFYDIQGHRWICCYPGADTKTLDLRINADGFEVNSAGELIPVATMGHGYEMMTYDTDAKRFLSMPNPHGYEKKALPQREKWWKEPPKDASPWMFETVSGQWNRLRTGTPAPPSSFGDTLIYLPTRKQAFFAHRSSDVWLYDIPANKWKHVVTKGPKPPFGIDATACYDSKRERIYIGGGSYPNAPADSNAFWIYDLKTDTWTDPKPKGAPCKGSTSYPTKNALMLYDSVNDVVLLVVHSAFDSEKSRIGVYVYDPNANAWSTEALTVPAKLGGNNKPKNGFYDGAANAVFIHTAGDSKDDGDIWVYRYKGRATRVNRDKEKEPIAAKYPNDIGIGKDPRVIFAEDFENWEPGTGKFPKGAWDYLRNPTLPQTQAVAGKVTLPEGDGPGKNVLMIACWKGGPNSAGLRKHLGSYVRKEDAQGQGYEEVYVRYYQKLDAEYTPVRNHGANLGGRDLTRPDSWWSGKANTTDVASHGYFFSGLQPYDVRRNRLYWGLYSYHVDKPDQWGDDYKPKEAERKSIEIGRWYCLERHLKLNSVDPVKADGVEELWVDGELAIRREGLRFRKVPELRITVFELEVYYHSLPDRYTEEKPIKVYYDNVVIATERIGVLRK